MKVGRKDYFCVRHKHTSLKEPLHRWHSAVGLLESGDILTGAPTYLMAIHRRDLPQLKDGLYLAYTGMETDLIFTHNADLPGFASFALLQSKQRRALLNGYYRDLVAVGKKYGAGVISNSTQKIVFLFGDRQASERDNKLSA